MTLIVASKRNDDVLYVTDVRLTSTNGETYDTMFKYGRLVNQENSQELDIFIAGNIGIWIGLMAKFDSLNILDIIFESKNLIEEIRNFILLAIKNITVDDESAGILIYEENNRTLHMVLKFKTGRDCYVELNELQNNTIALGSGSNVISPEVCSDIHGKVWNDEQNETIINKVDTLDSLIKNRFIVADTENNSWDRSKFADNCVSELFLKTYYENNQLVFLEDCSTEEEVVVHGNLDIHRVEYKVNIDEINRVVHFENINDRQVVHLFFITSIMGNIPNQQQLIRL